MSNLSGVITLQEIVDNVLNDLKNYSEENYKRYLQWAIRGALKLNIYHLKDSTRYAKLPVTSINTADLPDDFVDYKKIGLCINGKIWTLSRSDNMCMTITEECGEETNTNTKIESFVVDGTYYGLGGGYNISNFQIDYVNRRIKLDGNIPGGYIILEYTSTGIELSGNIILPIIALEALIAWVHFKRTEFDGGNPSQIQVAESRWIFECEQIENIQKGFTYDEIRDVFLRNTHQSIKR